MHTSNVFALGDRTRWIDASACAHPSAPLISDIVVGPAASSDRTSRCLTTTAAS